MDNADNNIEYWIRRVILTLKRIRDRRCQDNQFCLKELNIKKKKRRDLPSVNNSLSYALSEWMYAEQENNHEKYIGYGNL